LIDDGIKILLEGLSAKLVISVGFDYYWKIIHTC